MSNQTSIVTHVFRDWNEDEGTLVFTLRFSNGAETNLLTFDRDDPEIPRWQELEGMTRDEIEDRWPENLI